MTVITTKYVRKPLFVDVVRVSDALFEEIASWCQGNIETDEGTGKRYIHVRVHKPLNPRQTRAFVGDWILYTEKGYKVYTNKAFLDSFDEVGTQNGDVVLGHEEIAPGVTLNDAILALRNGTPIEELANAEIEENESVAAE